jgi:uncharacterized protein (TIGR00251 family)
MLTWYRAQTPQRQGVVSLCLSGAMVVLVLLAALLGLPVWVALGVACVGLGVSMFLRRVADLGRGRLRVRVHAPAVDGKANTVLCRVVAKHYGVRRSKVTIVRGDHARDKTLRVEGITELPA